MILKPQSTLQGALELDPSDLFPVRQMCNPTKDWQRKPLWGNSLWPRAMLSEIVWLQQPIFLAQGFDVSAVKRGSAMSTPEFIIPAAPKHCCTRQWECRRPPWSSAQHTGPQAHCPSSRSCISSSPIRTGQLYLCQDLLWLAAQHAKREKLGKGLDSLLLPTSSVQPFKQDNSPSAPWS